MTRYDRSSAQRFAISAVHGEQCYQCGQSLDLLACDVEHIIPLRLKDEPAQLAQVFKELGRPPDFDLFSLENVLPSCTACNRHKAGMVLDASIKVQVALQRAKEKKEDVLKVAARIATENGLSIALEVVDQARQAGGFTLEHLQAIRPLIEFQFGLRGRDLKREPLKIAQRLLLPGAQNAESDGIATRVCDPVMLLFRFDGVYVEGPNVCVGCDSRFFRGNRCVECGQIDDSNRLLAYYAAE